MSDGQAVVQAEQAMHIHTLSDLATDEKIPRPPVRDDPARREVHRETERTYTTAIAALNAMLEFSVVAQGSDRTSTRERLHTWFINSNHKILLSIIKSSL
jgi:hypothetical protein